jgi:hypothetical protein
MRTATHRPVPPLTLYAALALCAPALVLAGCGGDTPVIVNGGVLRLRLNEYRIVPQSVQMHPGKVQIIAFNTGILTHNVKVELEQRDAGGGQVVLGGTPTAQPGQQVDATLTLVRGRYLLVDTVSNHLDLGQFGTLVVK